MVWPFIMKTLKYFLYPLAALTFFVITLPAQAFSITPVKALLTVDPGTSQTIVLKIKNTEKNNLTFKLNVLGVTQDENGKPVFSRGSSLAESWVYPENNLVEIKSGETKSVNFIIKTPADAVAGSYYLGLSVEPVLAKTSQSSMTPNLISLLTLEVKGLVRESVNIEKWEAVAGVSGNKTWNFNLNLKNDGTIDVLMQGKITIKDWKGDDIFSEPIILGNKLLAGAKRVLHPQVILKNDINLPGLYLAQIKINYGRTQQTVLATVYVWYLPVWSKIVLAIIGLGIIFLATVIITRPKKVKV